MADIQLKILSNVADVVSRFQGIAKDQVPFATALALTRTAQDCRLRGIEEMKARFHVRRPFDLTVFRVNAATKDNFVASLGLTARGTAIFGKFLKDGDKTPTKGAAIAVPTPNVPEGGDRRVAKELWPETGTQKSASSKLARYRSLGLFRIGNVIFQRAGTGSHDLTPVFALTPAARIKERFGVKQWGPDTVNKNWSKNFQDAFIKAVKTAK